SANTSEYATDKRRNFTRTFRLFRARRTNRWTRGSIARYSTSFIDLVFCVGARPRQLRRSATFQINVTDNAHDDSGSFLNGLFQGSGIQGGDLLALVPDKRVPTL